ncbi:cytoplasmic protein [Pseudaminobacter sp. NGMCC 1.201702]|uniref:cytoplasmic protein n=1 Tax=Pseudaminobacter sp. NGMCC 1.201702 TaxID=3391825 RepID=UPI0039F12158
MNDIRAESAAFKTRLSAEAANARQMAALQLACGIDLSAALAAGEEERSKLVTRLQRAIERERLKGLRRHWSYDLNRHIALKQLLDRLVSRGRPQAEGGCA